MRTVTPRWWHWSTSSTAWSCGKSGSAMMTSCTRWLSSTAARSSIRPSERSPLSGRGVSEMKPTISTGAWTSSDERVRDVLDVVAGADQQRAPAVARGAQQHAGDLLVGPADRADVDDREEQRAVEDVVARVLLAVDDGEDQRHHGHLEQRGDDLRQARALGALGVEAGAGEQQRGHQVGERDQALGLLEGEPPGEDVVADERLEHQRREDRREHAREVERQQRDDPQDVAQRLGAQQEREQRRPLAADVHGRQRVRRRPRR